MQDWEQHVAQDDLDWCQATDPGRLHKFINAEGENVFRLATKCQSNRILSWFNDWKAAVRCDDSNLFWTIFRTRNVQVTVDGNLQTPMQVAVQYNAVKVQRCLKHVYGCGDWELERILRNNPTAEVWNLAKKSHASRNLTKLQFGAGQNMLHLVASQEVSCHTLQLLMSECSSSALKSMDMYGNLPVDIALEHKRSANVLVFTSKILHHYNPLNKNVAYFEPVTMMAKCVKHGMVACFWNLAKMLFSSEMRSLGGQYDQGAFQPFVFMMQEHEKNARMYNHLQLEKSIAICLREMMPRDRKNRKRLASSLDSNEQEEEDDVLDDLADEIKQGTIQVLTKAMVGYKQVQTVVFRRGQLLFATEALKAIVPQGATVVYPEMGHDKVRCSDYVLLPPKYHTGHVFWTPVYFSLIDLNQRINDPQFVCDVNVRYDRGLHLFLTKEDALKTSFRISKLLR